MRDEGVGVALSDFAVAELPPIQENPLTVVRALGGEHDRFPDVAGVWSR